MIVLISASSARAQQDSPSQPPRLIISDRAIAVGMAMHPPAPPQQSRDSLKNGAIIGGVVGGIAMGGFVGWLCHMLKEPGDPSCWKSVGYAGALGAAIGAAGGAGIDALAIRDPMPIIRTKKSDR